MRVLSLSMMLVLLMSGCGGDALGGAASQPPCDSYSPAGICLQGTPYYLPEYVDTAFHEVEDCLGAQSTAPLTIRFEQLTEGEEVAEFWYFDDLIIVRIADMWALKHMFVFFLYKQIGFDAEHLGAPDLQTCGF